MATLYRVKRHNNVSPEERARLACQAEQINYRLENGCYALQENAQTISQQVCWMRFIVVLLLIYCC